MDHPWFILFVLGLAAAFMPWQVVYEIYLLGKEGGLKKALAFVGGITLFRLLLMLVMGLLFAGISARVTETIIDAAELITAVLAMFGREATSGQRVILDLLLVLSGLLLLVESYIYYRGSKEDLAVEESAVQESGDRSATSIFMLGFGWTAISLKQWLFTLTAVNQILFIIDSIPAGIVLVLLFLFLASIFILIPIVFYLLQPRGATDKLQRLNEFINSTFFYLIVLLFFAGGLYLLFIGGMGLLNFATERWVLL